MKKKIKRNIFTSTRVKLDIIASLFIFFILTLFSYLVYSLLTQDIIYQISPVFMDTSIASYVDVDELFQNFRDQTLFLLIVSDIIIFVVSVFWFDRLVKQMLKPIEYTTTLQKRFAENLSHELRTPLSVINMNGEILAEKIEKEKKIKNEKFLDDFKIRTENILEETNGITTLIEDLLFEARIKYGEDKQGTMTLKEVKQNLKKVLKNLDHLKEKEVKLILEDNWKEEDLDKKIKVESLHLTRLFTNLLSNSFKFTSEGEIKIIFNKQKSRTKNCLQIIIFDTGVGINKKDLEKVSERFYRGKNVENSVSGTGVGLSIVKDLVHNYEWQMKINSKENEWTQVEINKIPLLKN